MSTIVAEVSDKEIVLVSDSAVTFANDTQVVDPTLKLWNIDDTYIVGGVGDAQLVKPLKLFFEDDVPRASTERGVFDFIRDYYGWLKNPQYKIELELDGELASYMIAFDGKLFYIEGLYVREIHTTWAMGSGMQAALAAFHLGASAEEACGVACRIDAFSRPPINVFTYDKKTKEIYSVSY